MMAIFTIISTFTLPRGYEDHGPNKGIAKFARKSGFMVCVIAVTVTVTMVSSMTTTVLCLGQISYGKYKRYWKVSLICIAIPLIWLGLVLMSLAFLSGLFDVLSNNMTLAIVVVCIGGVPSSGDENAMEVNKSQSGGDENAMEVNNSRLGLEPEDGNGVVQYEEDIVSSSVSNVHESSQDSLGPRTSATNSENTTNPLVHRTSDILMVGLVSADTNKTKIQDLASAAMEELREMATRGEPLWHRKRGDDSQPETLNSFEYRRLFRIVDAKLEKFMRMVKARDPNCMPSLDPSGHERLPIPRGDHYRPPTMPLEHKEQQSLEASRHIGYVDIMTAVSIVELFMNVNQWLATFENIVSSVTLLGVIST
ncbi:hypothetical protein EZV62_009144 [Acer yangbiense]|uniref:START domain-containing protein n=1 Tax=Acer yangbiense TaxID=1000413 RepID=A0A5C7IFU1_9ROSI|nr:hypothetical protein EZV62_009144 [Acer yangbiense]